MLSSNRLRQCKSLGNSLFILKFLKNKQEGAVLQSESISVWIHFRQFKGPPNSIAYKILIWEMHQRTIRALCITIHGHCQSRLLRCSLASLLANYEVLCCACCCDTHSHQNNKQLNIWIDVLSSTLRVSCHLRQPQNKITIFETTTSVESWWEQRKLRFAPLKFILAPSTSSSEIIFFPFLLMLSVCVGTATGNG